jgi:hypothetical protein
VSLNTAVQARLPWPVGVCKHRLNGRTLWEYYGWHLPDAADEQLHAHANSLQCASVTSYQLQ